MYTYNSPCPPPPTNKFVCNTEEWILFSLYGYYVWRMALNFGALEQPVLPTTLEQPVLPTDLEQPVLPTALD